MKEKSIFNYIKWIFTALLFMVSVCLQSIPISVFAETQIEYTDVMTDLRQDSDFDESAYPDVANKYSLKIIQIAESVNGELFVYVYQPSDSTKELTATEIRMSTPNVGVSDTPRDYRLKLLSTNGVFDKYIVEGFSVKTASVRYYEIVQLSRPWDSSIDGTPIGDSTTNTVACKVAQRYTATTIDNKINYTMLEFDVVEILNPFVGFLRYSDGFFLFQQKYTESHYIAFNTDYKIDKLISVDVEWWQADIVEAYPPVSGEPAIPVSRTLSLYADNDVTHQGNGWFSKEYEWQRIQTVEEFKKEDLTEETLNTLNQNNLQWVLRFTETSYRVDGLLTYRTHISQVTILRLEFESGNDTYNLSAVSNKVTGDFETPDNENVNELDLPSGNIFLLIGLIVALLIFAFTAPILNLIVGLVVSVISIPFEIIKSLFKRNKKE